MDSPLHTSKEKLKGEIKMLSSEWGKLQNGSDIRGIAMEGVEGQKVNLTDEKVEAIASAFALWLSNHKNMKTSELRVSIGTDSRISGPHIKETAISGLTALGCKVIDFSMASTPAMFMSTVTEGYDYDGAIMITASHLPFNRNGMKFFTNQGGLEKKDITDILTLAEQGNFDFPETKGNVYNVDFISVYAAGLVDKIRKGVNRPDNYNEPLKGFKVVVDAGNGAGGFFVDKVLLPLGADVTGSQFIEPDGSFPNHIPNPEDEKAMGSIVEAVEKNKADLGVIFDADVDRAGSVGSSGEEINRNRLIALMSAIVLEHNPGSVVVTDSVTSTGLKKFIEQDLKGVHLRFKRGYKNVINEAIRLNSVGKESCLAMETSGHGALKENYFLDDGAYLMTKILIKMARLRLEGKGTVENLIENLSEPAESMEFRMNINADNFKDYGNNVLSDLKEYVSKMQGWKMAPDNYEGIRVSFDKENGDGWFLLRMSLHDPLMPLNIESDSLGGVRIITEKVLKFLERYGKIDISSVRKYLG